MVTAAPGGTGAASALRTLPSGSAPNVASPPATRPERRRKSRRSRRPLDWSASAAASLPWRAWRSVLLISTAASLFRRIAVDAVKGFYVIGFFVTRLALLLVVLGIGGRDGRKRPGADRCNARACRHRAEEVATANRCLFPLFHRRLLFLQFRPAFSAGNAKASISTCMNN